MIEIENKQIISWLLDKAARAQDHSYARMLNMAAKRLQELDVTQNAVKWIPVSERLPDRNGEYLVCTFHDFYKTAKVAKASFKSGSGGFYGNGGHWSNVTHWMPLPKVPQEVE